MIRITDDFIQIVQESSRIASLSGATEIEASHVVEAIAHLSESLAARTLESWHADELRPAVPSAASANWDKLLLPLSDGATILIGRALMISIRNSLGFVGSEHVLIAVIDDTNLWKVLPSRLSQEDIIEIKQFLLCAVGVPI